MLHPEYTRLYMKYETLIFFFILKSVHNDFCIFLNSFSLFNVQITNVEITNAEINNVISVSSHIFCRNFTC